MSQVGVRQWFVVVVGRVHGERRRPPVPRVSRVRVPGHERAGANANASNAHKRTLCPKGVPTPEGNVSWA